MFGFFFGGTIIFGGICGGEEHIINIQDKNTILKKCFQIYFHMYLRAENVTILELFSGIP
jgi:hypothetical protein